MIVKNSWGPQSKKNPTLPLALHPGNSQVLDEDLRDALKPLVGKERVISTKCVHNKYLHSKRRDCQRYIPARGSLGNFLSALTEDKNASPIRNVASRNRLGRLQPENR
jgi:hypothetical protein